MSTTYFLPGAKEDAHVVTYRAGGDWTAKTKHGLTVQAKSEKTAVLKLARAVFLRRQEFGLVGQARLSAMQDCKNRLDAFALNEPTEGQLVAWRVRARALGCQAPAARGLDDWADELESRMELVRAYVSRTLSAGPMGRPGVRYSVILADPPWMFKNQATHLSPVYEGPKRKKGKLYSALPLPEILALGEQVQAVSAENAVLFLWVPASLVAQNYHGKVARAWGFEPKTLFPWWKTTKDHARTHIGGGNYTRTVHEECLVATQGDRDAWVDDHRLVISGRGRAAARIVSNSVRGEIFAPRTKHSAKPDAQYELIDALMGDVPKLELFARRARHGYDAWGDEV